MTSHVPSAAARVTVETSNDVPCLPRPPPRRTDPLCVARQYTSKTLLKPLSCGDEMYSDDGVWISHAV